MEMKAKGYDQSIYSSPAVVVFFFLLLLFLLPVERARGCSRILRISSSSIFLSDLYSSRSMGAGAASLVRPFLVMAIRLLGKLVRSKTR